MSILTKNALSASNQASFPNNTTGAITPQILRNFNQDVIDTLVDSLNTGSYAITTGSNDFTQPNNFTSISASSFVSASQFVGDGSKLTNITASVAIPISDEGILQGYATQLNFSGSNISASLQAGIATISVNTNNLVTTSSFNSYTSSNDSKVNSLISATASYANSASVAAVDAAQQSQINSLIASTSSFALTSLNAFTASQETKDATLGLYTASVDQKFTNIGGQSGSWDNTSLNAFTASQNTKNSTLATYTASVDTKFSNIGSQSASWDNTNLNSFTSSQNTKNSTLASYTGSNDTKWNTLGGQSGSWVTESETGSFARTNVTNVFTAAQTFTDVSSSGDIKGNSFQGGAARVDLIQTQLPANPGDLTILIPNGNVSVSSSISATGTFTSSLQQGYVWVGDSNNRTTLVATSSFAGTPTNITSLNAFTASQDTKNATLANVTASLQQQLTNIGGQSGSWITESETASFARTNVDNNFSVNQTFTNITAVSASFQYVQTTYETSSVIYSSGSNQFGDELSDIQTLSGSVKVQGTLTINGLPVATGSTDISSLNAFTASQDTKNSTLATYTASVNSQLSSLTNATASYAISSSVAAVDAAQQSQINSLIAATGSYITTPLTSLNSFTASQDTKNSTLATYTASVDSSLTNLNTFTASNGNTSLNSYTASNDTKWSNLAGQTGSYATSAITASSLVTASVNLNTITFTKGDASTFNITVNTGSGGGGTTNTGSLLITASAFTNTITFTKGDGTTFPVTVTTGSLNYVTGSFGAFYDTTTQSGSAGVAYSMKLNSTDISDGVIISGSGGIRVLAAGTYDLQFSAQVLADTGADTVWIWLKKNGTNVADTSTKLVLANNEANVAAWNFLVSANANDVFELAWQSSGGHTKLFAEAAASNYTAIPSVIATMNRVDVGGGTNLVSTASFNEYTASNDQKVNSLIAATGSYATTGSNSFIGNQTITGVLSISSSATYDLDITGGFQATAASRISGSAGILSFTQTNSQVSASTGTAIMGRGYSAFTINQNHIGLYASGSGVAGPNASAPIGTSGISLTSGSGAFDYYFPITFQTGPGYIDGTISVRTPLSASAGFTASLQNGYAWVGNSLGQNTQVATSSFGGTTDLSSLNAFTASQDTKNSTLATYTGSVDTKFATLGTQSGSWVTSAITASSVVTASFSGNTLTFTKGDASTFGVVIPDVSGSTINTGSFATTGSNSFIGSQSISGSFNLTGSAFGNVVSMSVSSNTASMDFNLGNYFELSASVSPIRIEVSNLKGGVTSTLALNGVTSSTINFSSNVLQPSGSAYTASVSGSNDILSFVAFNSNKVNVVSTLKMI
jgi:hypothetical protein